MNGGVGGGARRAFSAHLFLAAIRTPAVYLTQQLCRACNSAKNAPLLAILAVHTAENGSYEISLGTNKGK